MVVTRPGRLGKPSASALALSPASDEDFEALLALRLAAMQQALQRLGRYDPQRARERLSRAFEPAHTRHILRGSERVGFVVVLPQADRLVLDHLYIVPDAQRGGVGSWVMTQVLAEADALGLPVEVTTLKLGPTNCFYAHHGFTLRRESEWDLHYLRPARPRPVAEAMAPGRREAPADSVWRRSPSPRTEGPGHAR